MMDIKNVSGDSLNGVRLDPFQTWGRRSTLISAPSELTFENPLFLVPNKS